MLTEAPPIPVKPFSRREIEDRITRCSRLPSLRSIDTALRDLLNADQRYTSQISEIIRRDPSLSARLLRLVNSVYYGLTTPVTSIEEAVFYLGVRQIRQLAMVTPVIEDFQKITGKTVFAWRSFWQHCIGTAILTREVLSCIETPSHELDYLAGLLHDVGKIVIAAAFPEHFHAIYNNNERHASPEVEEQLLGMTHAEVGAIYLKNHNLPVVLIESTRFHHEPHRAESDISIVAAVQLADLLVRHAGIGSTSNDQPIQEEDWLESSGWKILFPGDLEERSLARANLKRSLERLPSILEGLV
jgi:putative nucleotidyltransferase with HDIG domain